jgi:hypothetical protein
MTILMMCVSIVALSEDYSKERNEMKEDAENSRQEVKHSVKKSVNRVKEYFCNEGDVKCAAKKLKHRIEEKKDVIIDNSKKLKIIK